MFIKIFSIILGAVFEWYYINIFMGCFNSKKIPNVKTFYGINVIVLIYHILVSCFAEGVLLSIMAFITTFLISLLYESRIYSKIFLSIVITVISISSEIIFGAIFILVGNGSHIDINTTPEAYLLGIFLSKFLCFVIVVLVKMKKQLFSITHLGIKYMVTLIVLPITTLVFGVFMNQIIAIITSTEQKLFYVFLNIFLIFSNILIFNVINHQNELAGVEYEFKLMKISVDDQIKHYTELKTSYEEIRRIKHDMKNTYLSIIAACESGNIKDVLEILNSNLDVIDRTNKIIDTGHPSIDTVLSNKLKYCEENEIRTNISCVYNNEIKVNEIEIAIIIGIILDNAIEACINGNVKKDIWGTILAEKHYIIIDLKNYTSKRNMFFTWKSDKMRHGFGLKSIKHICKKYNGKAKFIVENDVFTSFVTIDY